MTLFREVSNGVAQLAGFIRLADDNVSRSMDGYLDDGKFSNDMYVLRQLRHLDKHLVDLVLTGIALREKVRELRDHIIAPATPEPVTEADLDDALARLSDRAQVDVKHQSN